MNPVHPRFGPAFAATLALPTALAGTWAVLVHGGTIARAERTEAAAAAQCLAAADEALARGLAAAATTAFALELGRGPDGTRRVTGPFAAATPPVEPVAIGIAEQAAGAKLAGGDRAAAMPFLGFAADHGSLSPAGWLLRAELVAASDPAAADALLTEAGERFGRGFCGPLPFELLAALRAAKWTAAPAARARLAARAIAATARAPAAAIAPAVDAIVSALPEVDADPRLATLAAAAAFATSGQAPPEVVTPGPDGSALVPTGDRLAVIPAATVAATLRTAGAQVERSYPGFKVELPAPDPTSWRALPTSLPTSRLLGRTATASLALAIAAFVLGNLLLWRLARRELALVRMRRDFVDIVSHELRTPLTALSLKAEMLRHGDVPESRRAHYLQALHGDVERLTDQVERILAFGRLERGAPLAREPVPARAVLAKGLRAGRAALRLTSQRLEVEAPRTLPELDADVEVLTRALRNLLENAAKYAPARSTVAVRAFTDGRELVVEVTDEGPGVPADERRTIFEPFVRSRASSALPGSGLGLALVAAAAKAHGGRAEVRDRGDGRRGAVFVLRVPLLVSPEDRPEGREVAS